MSDEKPAKKKLMQYAVIYHPSDKERKDGKKSEIVIDMTTILAANDQEAFMLIAKKIPDEYSDRLDQVEIALRPF